MKRARFHCPTWCVVPIERHADELRQWEGGAVHWTADLADGKADDDVRVGLCTDAAGQVDGDVTIHYGVDVIDPVEALHLAAGMTKAVALAR